MKNWITGALLLFCSQPAFAELLEVEYSRFYSHLRKLNGDDVQALEFAFGFSRVGEGRLCEIQKAEIVTDKKTMPITVTSEQRFTLPQEKALKLASAMIRIELEEAANVCDMSVQLQTKPEYLKTYYSADELAMLIEQYEAFFNEMGSFLSFMMPSVKGLTFQFDDDNMSRPVKNAPNINAGYLQLPKAWLKQKKALTLPEKPLRVTAIASRD
ncbi:DUF2987 domain-containing protein [Salinimonas sp. HHU 13199]|uniref:DUF2987 domain-containing protein n=1 Tax=Salinimonas profundi TaxID=2729140 RepID=A0ABR8LDR6_9ALTE|nr:DUF2987 domain-containing protein [Salinimonas profundi]MBD3584440.1 DUF2987 domain-containing protein [Salinimonas profundi]